MAVSDVDLAANQRDQQEALADTAIRRILEPVQSMYKAGLSRWQSTGTPDIAIDARRDLAAQLSRLWMDAGQIGGRFAMDADKGAYPQLQTKDAALTFFEQIMFAFIQTFGAIRVRQITETTREHLVRLISQGVSQGLSNDAIVAQIVGVVPVISATRAELIARTEIHTAAMHASLEVAKSSPFAMNKRWISVRDPRTRDFGEGDGKADWANHRVMNEATVGIDELFSVPKSLRAGGGFDLMAGPGDPSAPPYQTIRCRCALIYRRAGRPWPKEGDNG